MLRRFVLVPAVVAAILFGFVMAQPAHAGVTVVVINDDPVCALVDGMVECEVVHPKGIAAIQVTVDSGIGKILVFDETYEDCPIQVQIVLDPIVIDASSELKVTPCVNPSGGVVLLCAAKDCPPVEGVHVVCVAEPCEDADEPRNPSVREECDDEHPPSKNKIDCEPQCRGGDDTATRPQTLTPSDPKLVAR